MRPLVAVGLVIRAPNAEAIVVVQLQPLTVYGVLCTNHIRLVRIGWRGRGLRWVGIRPILTVQGVLRAKHGWLARIGWRG